MIPSPKWSVICCLYNSFPVARKTIDALFRCPVGTEVLFVNNRGPDWEIIESYVKELEKAGDFVCNVKYFLPERNLGCHGGWNTAYQLCCGDYVVKIDDDTVPLVPDWLEEMSSALADIPELGIVAGNVNESAKQNKDNLIKKTVNGHELEVAYTGIVGFSCVMFRRADVKKWGLMKTGEYRFAGEQGITKGDRLYGGEEVFYSRCARENDQYQAYLIPATFFHADNEKRDEDYVFWKRVYGFYGWTDKDLSVWRKSPERVRHYHEAVLLELSAERPNDILLRDWCNRLGDIGNAASLDVLAEVESSTKNDVVKEATAEARDKIAKRGS